MAMNVYEGGTITIKADTTQAKKELLEVSKILDELEKNQTKLDPKFNFNDIKKDVDKLGRYIEGRFGALDFSKVYTNLMRQAQGNPNAFAKNLERTMRGFNLLEQAVKPEDISKLAAASAQEINDLIKNLGGLAPTTKATGSPVIKKLQALYDKYPNGIEGLGGSGKGGGFGASEEALNRIGDTLERIDTNVQNISESIRNGTSTLKDASQSAKEYAGNMEKAETAASKMQTAVDKMKQKQQNVKNALEGEKVEADWDWSLQYINGAKTSTQKKASKPKTQAPGSQPEIRTSVPDVTPIKKVVKAEEELRNAVEGANNALREQNAEINTTQGNTQKVSKKSKGDTFSNIQKTLNIPKEIKGYLKSPAYIARNLAGFEDSAIENLDWDTLVENIEKEAIANVKGKTLDEKLDRINGIVDGKKVNDPIDVYAKLKQAVAFVQQIQAMYSPEEADKLLSGFSILQDRVNNDWYEDIGDLFFNEATPDIDIWDMLIEKMHEWAIQYNEKVSTLHEGLSQAEIESRKAEEQARQEIMKGFTKEDVENANLGAKGTPALYDAKITETQDRLSKMSELKTLLEQEKEQGKELSQIENDFLKNYSTYEVNANKIITTANERKAVLENPDLVRQANEQKRKQTEESNKVTFSQDVMEAAHAQEELAKSVREANSALQEQNNVTKDNIMYHMGNLSSSKTKEISHPFGDEFNSYKNGQRNGGRGWADGTGLYVTAHSNEYTERSLDNKDFTQFYAIDTSGLKLYEAHTEEAASDFYNFIHHLEQLCLALGTATTEFDNEIKDVNDESLYQDFQRVFPGIKLTFDQFEEFIESMSVMISESGLDANGIKNSSKLNVFRKQFGNEDIKTRFLKMLGYEGTNLTGTSYGGIQSGSVLFGEFDKKRIITSGKDLDTVVQQAETAKEQTKQDVEEAKKNAEEAKKAAEEGKKAVEEVKDNKEKADAVIPASESAPNLQSAVESAEQAEAETEKEVAYVEHSFDALNNYLRQYTQELAQKKQERDTLLQQIQSLQDGAFDTSQRMPGASATFDDAIEASGQSKEDYLKGMLEHDTQQLEAIEQQIVKKQAQVLRVNKEHAEVEELVKQGFDVQEKQKSVKKNKKGVIINQVKDEIKAEQEDIEEAQQLLEEEKREAEELKKKKEAADQVLRDTLGDEANKKKNAKRGQDILFGSKDPNKEPNSGKGSGGARVKVGNLPNYNTPGSHTNGGASTGAQQIKVVYQVETTNENLKTTKRQLKDLNDINKNLTTSANQVADAINKEAEAFGKMAETLANIGQLGEKVSEANQIAKDTTTKVVNQTLKPDQTQAQNAPASKPATPLLKPKAAVAKESDEIRNTKKQIEELQKLKEDAEQDLKSITLDDSLFDVGDKYQKRNAYTQVKQWADDLKKAQEEVNKLGKDADSQKAQEVLNNYDKMRVGFSKAYEKAIAIGTPKNLEEQMKVFEEQYLDLGRPSKDFEQVEERFTQASTQAAEQAKAQFEQQKQQAEVIMARLQARLEELQAKEKAASSPVKPTTESKPSEPIDNKPDLGGNQTGNGIKNEGDEAGDATAKMKELATAKKEVTEANQKLAQSAQNTTDTLNNEGNAGANANEAFDSKPLEDRITAQDKMIDSLRKQLDEEKAITKELQSVRKQADEDEKKRLEAENKLYQERDRKDIQKYREAGTQAQILAQLQKKQFEEEERVRKEQEAKATQKAEERAKKAEENARIKAEDKNFSKLYTEYGKDFSAILDAKSIQEFDAAVAHLTETERQFWEARMSQAGGTAYAHQSDMLKQNDLPEEFEKSADNQTAVLKQREMAIAEYTANVIAELEKQESAFEKMDVLYQIDTEHPANGHASFIQNSLVDEEQTRAYVSAIEEVTESLQRMREIVQSMKDGTFDFGNIDALRELFELRQNLATQISTTKEIDKDYKGAQGQIEAKSIEKAEQYQTILSGLEKQIEKIQTSSKTLINPNSEYKTELEGAKELLATIQIMIEEIKANPLQFMGEKGSKNAKVMQSTIDEFKEGIEQFQEDFQSQTGIQGRINTFFTSYKGAYTSFFREIKDSFKSQALGELQKEIDQTFKTFEDSINNLNRATGLNQGEFLNKYLNTNGGKATAGQIEQQQKIRNAIAESYRGLITDISDELTKVEDRMSEVFGEKFLDQDYFQNFDKTFTAGLGDATKFKDFQNNAESAVQSLNKLKDIQEQMASGQLDLTQLAPDELKKQIQEIVELFANLNEKYKDVIDGAKDFTFADIGDIEKQRAGITQFLKNNQGISSQAKTELQEYFNQLQQGISQADLTKLTDGWHQVADAEQAAGRTGSTFLSELQTRFKSLSAYLLSFVSFYRIIGVFKDGINIIHQLDDALTEMQKVSDESLSSLREYQKSTFDTANQIGTTAQQLQQSTADWMRLGEDLQTASQSAQTANVLFNVSEFDNINEATTALVAMSAAYADAEKGIDKIDIVDRLNLIGNNYAIATDELATALQDGAAALQTAGKQHCQNL